MNTAQSLINVVVSGTGHIQFGNQLATLETRVTPHAIRNAFSHAVNLPTIYSIGTVRSNLPIGQIGDGCATCALYSNGRFGIAHVTVVAHSPIIQLLHILLYPY